MSESSSIIQRLQALPRAIQWLAIAIVLVVAFRLWVAVVQPVTEKWDVKADEITEQVAEVRRGSVMAARLNGREMTEVVLAIGPVAPPGDHKTGGQLLHEAAIAVTGEYGSVAEVNFDLRSDSGNVPRQVSNKITTGTRLKRLTAELKFVAAPEDAISIIAELENHPDIESVSGIRLTRSGDRTLKVSLDLESWVEES